ncbi:PDZ domain-containing protein 8 isoform X1 [Bombyx mandarina]|uniref:PDZ domain-containing protein 8 isoform X1 n=1 Tax=Bombyx mandarina TaxID=7092 RepID=A0A6J2JUG8_BOMMA|nr:PDZ domain-containing protein 8 isoform X1 [Bombyx mandarina]XP_028033491.1 PDZ domain-containing protein 8 isoform X1 [Bombyx mandarina]XP_028033492.1 PDZ domain-containing protein 8 isoform X1 [Bombyx mandarina]
MPDWTWMLFSALFGAVSALTVPLLLLMYYVRPFEKRTQELDQFNMPVTLPLEILNELTRGAGSTPEGALNAMLQFIFQQSTADTRWLRRRMATELAELLAKTSSGKIFESLTLRSLEVGTEFPSINNLHLLSGELEEDGARLRSLDLKFDLAYDGNFRIDVDAVMLLGKIANISITVESLSGNVRLMFRRTPYTHWALAFEAPPKLELKVRGRFQGRQLKPRLASLVAAHIRRAVAQRHTLPNYKIRYKPFFPKSEPGSGEADDGPTPQGRLTVRLVEVTRLQWAGASGTVRAALAVDSHAWVSLRRGVLVLDVVLPAVSGPLGLVCCQGVGVVLVDTVVPMSPAYRADLRRDDVVLAIDNKPINNVAQVGKLLRLVERRAVTVRVRRGGSGNSARREDNAVEPKRIKPNFSFRRVSEVMEGVRLQGIRAAASKSNLQESESPVKASVESHNETDAQSKPKTEPVRQLSKSNDQPSPSANFGLRKRRCSVENKSSDSSAGSTPPASGASTPLRQSTAVNKTVKHPEIPIIRTDSSECKVTERVETLLDDDELFETGGPRQCEHVEICQMFLTKSIQLKPIIPFDEETEFKLNENHKYLNINVWATVTGEKDEVLLGYLNIPLAALLSECQDSTVPHHMKRYQFLPPDVDIKFSKSHKLASHAGFEPCLCFGDALVWWEWDGAATRSAPRPPVKDSAPPRPPKLTRAVHDFVRTHFHRSTQCDFCNKKIWLKDAMQCRSCGLCCHKKCVTKCQESSPCVPKQDLGLSCPPPELIMTEADSVPDPDSDEEPDRKDSLEVHEEGGGAMSALVAGLRRAGSAHSLSAPKTSASSRSLPPSPSHTPRKQSLESVGNPFGACGVTWAQRGDVSAVLAPALRSALPPNALLAAARDAAPDLAASLSAQQIHDMLLAVREELSAEDASVPDGAGGEGRAYALTALMLHCCAAAQLAQQRADAAPDNT